MRRIICFTLLIAVLLAAACTEKRADAQSPTPQAPGQVYEGRQSHMVFKAVAAGGFYTDNPTALRTQVDGFIEAAQGVDNLGEIFGVIAPHAGYIYSGPVAGYSYRAVKGKQYDVIVVLGLSHRVPTTVSLLDYQTYRTPLGDVQIDVELTKKLAAAAPFIDTNDEMFLNEHSLEVQLPFIQRALPNTKVVMVGIGTINRSTLKELAAALDKVFAGKHALFVGSTDLSHFRDYESAREIDLETLAFVGHGDLDGMWATRDVRERMCGLGPITTLLELYKLRGGKNLKVLKYLNSGDTSGDHSRVVGYGSVALLAPAGQQTTANAPRTGDEDPLSPDDKKMLLHIARDTVTTFVKTGKKPDFQVASPALKANGAAFVTLRKGPTHELRGCIGQIIAMMPLWECVREMAVAAASQDPRFSPVRPTELGDINIEISVLTPPVRVRDVAEIQVGVHGLIMSRGFYRGLLLPQVPTELGWDRDTFLDQTCVKAGMQPGCWRDRATTIERFTAIVFSE